MNHVLADKGSLKMRCDVESNHVEMLNFNSAEMNNDFGGLEEDWTGQCFCEMIFTAETGNIL